MAVKIQEVALGVRVVFNNKWKEKCLGDAYLKQEKVLYISEKKTFNDQRGEYVHIRGGSGTNSGYAYLDELDLEFDWRKTLPLDEAFKKETSTD